MQKTCLASAGCLLVAVAASFGAFTESYKKDEYRPICNGLSPDRRFFIATHGEGGLGYDNFHLYLFDTLRGNKVGVLEEIRNTLDTSPGAFAALWDNDSSEVTIVYRINEHAPLKSMTYRIDKGRAFPLSQNPVDIGRKQLDQVENVSTWLITAEKMERMTDDLDKAKEELAASRRELSEAKERQGNLEASLAAAGRGTSGSRVEPRQESRTREGVRIAVVQLHELTGFLEKKADARRSVPAELDPKRNPDLEKRLEEFNRLQSELRRQINVLRARDVADRAEAAAAQGRPFDEGIIGSGPPWAANPMDFADDPKVKELQSQLKPLQKSLSAYFMSRKSADRDAVLEQARQIVRDYAGDKYDIVYDSFHGTTFFADNFVVPRGATVVDITQAVMASLK